MRGDNIAVVLRQMKEAWKDYPDMQFRVIVEAWDTNVGRMDARYADGYWDEEAE